MALTTNATAPADFRGLALPTTACAPSTSTQTATTLISWENAAPAHTPSPLAARDALTGLLAQWRRSTAFNIVAELPPTAACFDSDGDSGWPCAVDAASSPTGERLEITTHCTWRGQPEKTFLFMLALHPKQKIMEDVTAEMLSQATLRLFAKAKDKTLGEYALSPHDVTFRRASGAVTEHRFCLALDRDALFEAARDFGDDVENRHGEYGVLFADITLTLKNGKTFTFEEDLHPRRFSPLSTGFHRK